MFTFIFHSSVLYSILLELDRSRTLHLETLHYLVDANQLGLLSNDPIICNFLSFPCHQRDLQSRTVCGLVKPLCPVLKFTCQLCRYYLSTKSCRKTCQTAGKYCGSSGCNSSSIEIATPSEPITTEITNNDGKKYYKPF